MECYVAGFVYGVIANYVLIDEVKEQEGGGLFDWFIPKDKDEYWSIDGVFNKHLKKKKSQNEDIEIFEAKNFNQYMKGLKGESLISTLEQEEGMFRELIGKHLIVNKKTFHPQNPSENVKNEILDTLLKDTNSEEKEKILLSLNQGFLRDGAGYLLLGGIPLHTEQINSTTESNLVNLLIQNNSKIVPETFNIHKYSHSVLNTEKKETAQHLFYRRKNMELDKVVEYFLLSAYMSIRKQLVQMHFIKLKDPFTRVQCKPLKIQCDKKGCTIPVSPVCQINEN